MRYLENLNDTSVIKHGDSSETLRLSARNDNEPVTWDASDTATIHVNQVGKQIPAKLVVGSNNVLVDSGDLADLAAGKYGLELWVTLKSGKTAIWPSDGSLEMTIDKNSDEITGDTVTTITLEDLEKRVDDKIADGLKNIKLDPSQIPSVDLSDYAKKSDVPSVIYNKDSHTLTVNGVAVDIPADVDLSQYAKKTDLPHVDLTPYITASDADNKFALKSDVPSVKYDAAARTLTVNGQQVSLPASVDLSNYALKSSVPDISLDVAKRTLTLNGVSVTIPQQVDLSKYALSSQVPSVKLGTDHTLTVDGVAVKIPADVDLTPYAKSADVDKKIDQKLGSIPPVDLTAYVKKTDLADYARKSDIPVVPNIALDATKRTLTISGQNIDIPAAVDLTQYAKVGQVPKIALDVEKRTITVDGKSIDVPRDVDLSGYVTEAELTSKLADAASGGKIDLTGYVTKSDADATYETKADALQLMPRAIANNIFAKKTDLPKVTYDTKTRMLKFTQNGAQPVIVTIPDEADLSPYLKATTADATYAKKSDIPAAVDLTPYLKTADADTKYAKNEDLASYAKKTDLSNYVDTNTFNENIAGMAGQIPQITYDSAKHTLNVNGTTVAIPQEVDMTPYMKAADAEQTFAKKSDVPSVVYDDSKKTLTINGKAVEIPANVDLSGYAKLSDLPKEVQDELSKTISVDKDGFHVVYEDKYGRKIGQLSDYVHYNADSNTLYVHGHGLVIPQSDEFLREDIADSKYASKNDLSKIPSITRDNRNDKFIIGGYDVNDVKYSKSLGTLWVGTDAITIPNSSNFAPLDWVNGSFARKDEVPDISYDTDKKQLTVNGKTIDLSGSGSSSPKMWLAPKRINNGTTTLNGETVLVAYTSNITKLDGKTYVTMSDIHVGDIVIGEEGGLIYRIVQANSNVSYPILLSQVGQIGKGSLSAPNNLYDSWNGITGMAIIPKSQLKSRLGINDTDKYTLDIDNEQITDITTNTSTKLAPGIYQLRDHSISNLTISSADNYGLGDAGSGATPIQMTVTPYKLEVVLVSGTDVITSWRSCWLFDNSAWFGVTDKWHVEK